MENIVLIGFSGSGKTTTGRLLADRLGKTFVDVDHEIEKTCGMSVDEIFRVHGENFFREQERSAVQCLLRERNAVIATGGGAVLSPDNVADMKKCGVVISLLAPAEVILDRIERDTVARPLLKKQDRLRIIKDMLHDRNEKYQVSDFAVETGTLTPQKVTEKIIEMLRTQGFLAP